MGEKCLFRRAVVNVGYINCPKCGEEIEYFSDEEEVECENCGEKIKIL